MKHAGIQTDNCGKLSIFCQNENSFDNPIQLSSYDFIKMLGENKGIQTNDDFSVEMYPRSTQTDLNLLSNEQNKTILSNDSECQTYGIISIETFTQTDFLMAETKIGHNQPTDFFAIKRTEKHPQFLLPNLISGTLLAALAGTEL